MEEEEEEKLKKKRSNDKSFNLLDSTLFLTMPKGTLFSWWYMLEEQKRVRCETIVRSLAAASGLSSAETAAAVRRCSAATDEARFVDAERLALHIVSSVKPPTR